MRITEVKVLLHDRVSPRLAVFGVRDGRLPMGVLRISTDAGIEGHNFLSYPGPGPLGIAQQIVTFIKPLLLGADPLDIGVHWRRMAGLSHFISPIAMGTVDVALWDIAGKAAGMPIHRLLGTCRDRIPVYFDYPQALQVGKAIQDLGYYWYEDPLPAHDINGYQRLKQQLHIPILATEVTPGGLEGLPPWITAQATDFLRGDVVIKGGITGLMKIAHLAEAFNMNCEIHDAYNAMNNIACLQVMMAIDNCDWFEVLAFNRSGDHSLEHLSYGLTDPFEVDAEGNVHAPAGAGLGVEIDWELINASLTGEVA